MARVTVEDCIKHYPNRFELVLLAARRSRQLMRGMAPMVQDDEMHKYPVQALKEIGEGHVTWERLFDMEEIERQRREAAMAAEEDEEGEAQTV